MKAIGFRNNLFVLLLITLLIHSVAPSAFAAGEDIVKRTTDYDADGMSDLTLYYPTTSTFDVRLSTTLQTIRAIVGNAGDIPVPGEYNAPGDGRTDRATFNRATAVWTFKLSNGEESSGPWGNPGDFPVPANYRGNACTDLAVYDPKTAVFTIADCLSAQVDTYTVGNPGGIPVPGDYDGDGKDDPATFNRSDTPVWTIRQSSDNSTVQIFFGLAEDIPLPGRYLGDDTLDLGVYRPSANTIYIRRTSDGSGPFVYPFGLSGDLPVTADIDGDEKLDFTVFRPSANSYITQASTGPSFIIPWMASAALAPTATALEDTGYPISPPQFFVGTVEGDFNGDRRSELAVVSALEETNTWTIVNLDGTSVTEDFGFATDRLLSGDTNGDRHFEPIVARTNAATGGLDWYIHNRTGDPTVVSYGLGTDTMLRIGDFDCDGRDDFAVVRVGSDGYLRWFVRMTTGTMVEDHLFGYTGDSVFAADFDGDSCDEMVAVRSRADLGLTQWFAESLVRSFTESALFGLSSDTPLGLADFNGDGLDQPVVVRTANSQNTGYIRRPDGEVTEVALGSSSGMPFLLNFEPVGRAGLAVAFIDDEDKDNATYVLHYANGVSVTNTLPLEFGANSIVPPRGDSIFLGEFEDDPIGCDFERSFRDGGGGWLYKPFSDGAPGKAVTLMPPSFYFQVSRLDVYDRNANRVAGAERKKCCPNGNRGHFWLNRPTSALTRVDPLTIRYTLRNGDRWCLPVPNASSRID